MSPSPRTEAAEGKALKVAWKWRALNLYEPFNGFLLHGPRHDRQPWEGYSSLFHALLFAGAACDSEGSVGGGRCDLHLRSEAGDDHVIEVKRLEKDDAGSPRSLAAVALRRIDPRRYASRFQGGSGRVFMVAVVVGGRACLEVLFEPAENPVLETLADWTRRMTKADPA